MKTITQKSILVLLGLVLAQKAFTQAPNISYSGPFTFSAGTTITPATVSNSGGAAAINGQTTTFAGSGSASYVDGTGTAASFNQPLGAVADASGNIYIADVGNQRIRKITPAGVVTTFAGTGTPGSANGTGTLASFYHPVGMCVDASGNIYVADEDNNMIRKITQSAVVTTIGGQTAAGYVDGSSATAKFNLPCGVAVDGSGNVFVADYNNNVIRKITSAGTVSTFAGSTLGTAGSANGTGTAATFNHPFSVAIDASGTLYVADRSNNMIRMITSAGVVTTLAGQTTAGYTDATGTAAKFNVPTTVTVDHVGNVYVADESNNRIRKIVIATGAVTTLSGTGTAGSANSVGSGSTFNNPFGITVDASGDLFVCDYSNNLVREVISTPYTIASALPAGLSFSSSTGTISGTPTMVTAAANYSVTAYCLTASSNNTTSANITIDAAGSVNPTQNLNFIAAYTPRVPNNTSTALNTASVDKTQVETAIQYFDGIGRPLQTIQAKGSPLGYDVVQPIAYDQFGREVTKYLPYAPQTGTPGGYRPNAVSTDQNAFYTTPPSGSAVSAITDPYSQVNLESSPLSRPLEQGAPGVAWQLTGVSGGGHTVKIGYTANNSIAWATDSVNSMKVARYDVTINSDQSRTLTANGFYTANQLDVIVSKDENWVSGRAGTIEEYKDKEGHVVLKRMYNYTNLLQQLSTYYIYDDLGNLAFVLPPAANGDAATTISQTTLNNLCYQYRYDNRNRMSKKKIPGKGWEYVVYNYIDQPVASQDSLQRANNQWVITKYDAMGRPVMTGIWNNGGTAVSQTSLQGTLTGLTTNLWETSQTTGNGYSNVAWPTTNITSTLTLNYYDNYTNVPGLASTPYSAPTGYSTQTRGLTTAKLTAVLNIPPNMLWDVVYYDDLGRSIKTYAQHYLGGVLNNNNYDATTITYNFTNVPTSSARQHWNTTSISYPLVTIANTYLYDHMGRKIKTWEQITNGNNTPTAKTLLSKIDYNEIGQVRTKHLHSTDSLNFMQNVAYTYNERGWLLSSSAPLFEMDLYYNTLTNKAYNGNIMYQYWGTPGNISKRWIYAYDKLDRLSSGSLLLVPSGTAANLEQPTAYDLNGNITALSRYDATRTIIDNLTYTYTGNQLQSVTDGSGNNTGLVNSTTNYTYDGNGNMLSNSNSVNNSQDKSFTYNLLNLLQVATVHTGTVTYTYDATGNKLRKVSTVLNNSTDYVAGIQYDGTATPALSFIQTEEGKAVPNGAGYDYVYYLGDNLGNTRVTFGTKTGSAVSYQTDDYYPFGMEILNNVTSPKNEYLYNKKEKQEELQEYDYGARFYDPVIARWTTTDPLAEVYHFYTPYAYTLNNPLKFKDPNGKEVEGETTADARKIHDDINKVFANEKFSKFRALIQQTGRHGNGYKFKKIDANALSDAVSGLSGDDLALAKIVAGTINSGDVHKIEYKKPEEELSNDAKEGMDATLTKVFTTNNLPVPNFPSTRYGSEVQAAGGSGENFPTPNGSISVILEGTGIVHSGGRREIDSFHELFGHGVATAKRVSDSENNANAIRTENLVRRVLGITDFRDGTNPPHSGGRVDNPTALPSITP